MAVQLEHLCDLPCRGTARRLRVTTQAGSASTVHVAEHDLDATRVRVARVHPAVPLIEWCRRTATSEAVNGGFFTKPQFEPLGELRIEGTHRGEHPFRAPWNRTRGALHLDVGGRPSIAPRDQLPPNPDGDLVQAGPLLVAGGRAVVAVTDPEGFSTTCDEFDSDITIDRHPRCAIALTAETILAVSVDGRGEEDAGLYLHEFADLLVALGARAALNLDGGASSALVTAGALRNCPRDDEGQVLDGGYPVTVAIAFDPR